jgi:type I site-specific restriction endonuclease
VNTEADTCRKIHVPKLQAADWDNDPHSIAEQRSVTHSRIVPVGKGFVRKPPKRMDYLLRYRRDFPLAVVEAKADYKSAAAGVQQARQYSEMLGLENSHMRRMALKSFVSVAHTQSLSKFLWGWFLSAPFGHGFSTSVQRGRAAALLRH